MASSVPSSSCRLRALAATYLAGKHLPIVSSCPVDPDGVDCWIFVAYLDYVNHPRYPECRVHSSFMRFQRLRRTRLYKNRVPYYFEPVRRSSLSGRLSHAVKGTKSRFGLLPRGSCRGRFGVTPEHMAPIKGMEEVDLLEAIFLPLGPQVLAEIARLWSIHC